MPQFNIDRANTGFSPEQINEILSSAPLSTTPSDFPIGFESHFIRALGMSMDDVMLYLNLYKLPFVLSKYSASLISDKNKLKNSYFINNVYFKISEEEVKKGLYSSDYKPFGEAFYVTDKNNVVIGYSLIDEFYPSVTG